MSHERWENLYQYNDTPNSWTQVYSGALRQIVAGSYGRNLHPRRSGRARRS
jgi:hypothetical protein